MAGDVRDAGFCRSAVDETVAALGGLDILVNNAAFQQHVEAIEDLSEAQFDMTMRTNVFVYFHMVKAALPHLPAGGAIINTGSETGLFGSTQLLDYSATKGAIHAFSKALASHVIDRGIRVNVVAPGPVWTPLNPADRAAEAVAEFGSQTSLRRPAQPEEIAPAYVFLAAPVCSSFITGIELPIMGRTPGGPQGMDRAEGQPRGFPFHPIQPRTGSILGGYAGSGGRVPGFNAGSSSFIRSRPAASASASSRASRSFAGAASSAARSTCPDFTNRSVRSLYSRLAR